jgi:hypothetical protein
MIVIFRTSSHDCKDKILVYDASLRDEKATKMHLLIVNHG